MHTMTEDTRATIDTAAAQALQLCRPTDVGYGRTPEEAIEALDLAHLDAKTAAWVRERLQGAVDALGDQAREWIEEQGDQPEDWNAAILPSDLTSWGAARAWALESKEGGREFCAIHDRAGYLPIGLLLYR